MGTGRQESQKHGAGQAGHLSILATASPERQSLCFGGIHLNLRLLGHDGK